MERGLQEQKESVHWPVCQDNKWDRGNLFLKGLSLQRREVIFTRRKRVRLCVCVLVIGKWELGRNMIKTTQLFPSQGSEITLTRNSYPIGKQCFLPGINFSFLYFHNILHINSHRFYHITLAHIFQISMSHWVKFL